MGLKIKRKTRNPEEIPLASTSDIAFLLIVFFLTASSLLEFRGIKLPLPKPDAPPMQILRENILRLYVDRSGAFSIDKRVMSLDELQLELRSAYQKNSELVVVLKVHPDAPSKRVPEVINRIQKEGITKFSMGIEETPRR